MKTLNKRIDSLQRFFSFVYHHFIEDDCMYRASALAFTSLLAVVPLMSVGLAVLSAFPVFQNLSNPVQDFIFENFVPATGKVVQVWLQQFSAQVSRLSIFGIAFLIVTALMMMLTIEQAMNRIWRVKQSRHGVSAFLLYWTILSLAPLLLGLSFAASSYIFSLPFIRDHHTPSFILNTLPFFLSLTAYTFLFVIVPNCHVKFRHGFIGALFAAVMFESAKQAFAWYLGRYNTYQLLYGAFAIVPIFFIWVYYVWLITLLSAEIAYALAVHHQRRNGAPLDPLNQTLLWLKLLAIQQRQGTGLSFENLIQSHQHAFSDDPKLMLQQLQQKGLIDTNAHGEYVLLRNPSHLTIYDVYQIAGYPIPAQDKLLGLDEKECPWKNLLIAEQQDMAQRLAVNIDTFVEMKD